MKTVMAALLALLLLTIGLAFAEVSLPADLEEIGPEAFMNIPMRDISLPERVRVIGSRAFKGTNLRYVDLPAGVQSIAKDAFEGCPYLLATVEPGSYAQAWCDDNCVDYVLRGFEDAMPEIFNYTADMDNETNTQVLEKIYTSDSVDAVALYDTKGIEVMRWTGYTEGEFCREWLVAYNVGNYFFGSLRPFCGTTAGECFELRLYPAYGETTCQWVTDALLNHSMNIDGEYCGFIPRVQCGVELDVHVYASNTSVTALRVEDQNGNVLMDERGIDFSQDRSFTGHITFQEAGEYELNYLESVDGESYVCRPYPDRATVVDRPQVMFAHAPLTVKTGETFDIWTAAMPGVSEFGLFSGNTKLASWTGYDVDNTNSQLAHFITEGILHYAFDAPGRYSLTLKGSPDGVDWSDPGEPVEIRVSDAPQIKEILNSTTSLTVQGARMVVRTTQDAAVLRMVGEDGGILGQWSDEDSEISGNERVWTVVVAFPGDGIQNIGFCASADGEQFGDVEMTYVVVCELPRVESVYADTYGMNSCEDPVPFEISASNSAEYVGAWDESGTLLFQSENPEQCDYSWWYHSFLEEYAFDAPGVKSLNFRASLDGEHWGPAYRYVFNLPESASGSWGESAYSIVVLQSSLSMEFVLREGRNTIDELCAVRLTDAQDNELGTWDRTQLEYVQTGDKSYATGMSHTFPQPGTYPVKIWASTDGESFIFLDYYELKVRPRDLVLNSSFRSLAGEVGAMKFEKTLMSLGYDLTLLPEHYESMLTPKADPGAFYVTYSDAGAYSLTQDIKLCKNSGWSIGGLEVGMTYAQMLETTRENELALYGVEWTDADDGVFCFEDRDACTNYYSASHCVFAVLENGKIVELRAILQEG